MVGLIISTTCVVDCPRSPLFLLLICDDTDVFVLLTHYFAEESLSVPLIMDLTDRSRSSIDIGATVAKHSGIVPQLIASHAVSGCDTVSCYHGIRKTKVVKALSAGIE